LIHDPDWRGDWNTVEQWVREGFTVGCHVIPAIEEQVRNFGECYRQPHHLSGFAGVIRKYVHGVGLPHEHANAASPRSAQAAADLPRHIAAAKASRPSTARIWRF